MIALQRIINTHPELIGLLLLAALLAGCQTSNYAADDERLLGIWEPNDKAQGGRAVVMLPTRIEATRVVVNGERSAAYLGRVEDRATFVMPRAGAMYHTHSRVIAYNGNDMVDGWWVENPRKRGAFR
ncbi:MAG TPA: hypothetical protein VMZ31_11190 [Phycisphaerae bacterium]|nr:hypothetical protein [Phycisphaerae bacterium]